MSEPPSPNHPAPKRNAPDSPDSPSGSDSRAKSAKLLGAKLVPHNVIELSLPDGLLDPKLSDFTSNLIHQINALGLKPGGLAAALVDRCPYANPFEDRNQNGTQEHLLGTVRIDKDPSDNPENPTIFSLYAQLRGGAPGKHPHDSREHRVAYFESAIADLKAKAPGLESIAFPEKIGCAIAGGHWHDYKSIIHGFAAAMPNCAVYIVRCEKLHNRKK